MPPGAAAVSRIAPLVFFSGACALVYQLAWVRELRLTFGASTAASAAVIAIFMGGLGAGGLVLGPRADRHEVPLELYARLELGVAVSAALTPILCAAVRWLYVRLGGAASMGALAVAARLALSALVLGPPTFLMGGTLPAAARAAARDDDRGRRDLALLYGANTLGAVIGATLATFVLLEFFGTRLMLWSACLVNVLVAMGARTASRSLPPPARRAEDDAAESAGGGEGVPRRFVLAAAAIVGFAFFLMEIVWYRMLAPVLGGSSYTFGLVLAVALLGVGLGGAARAAWGGARPATLQGFALTCALEALCLALPLALGDRVAVLALLLRALGGAGLAGLAAGWTVVASVVILPAALVAGWQFPLLVALLGEGGRRVGRDVALAYAWNTAGAIAGSLAGGFGLLPLLTAPGVWRASAALLAALGIVAALQARGAWTRAVLPVLATLASAPLLLSRGPTAAWRHSAVGAGREYDVASRASPAALTDWIHRKRRDVAWEAEGIESNVSATKLAGLAFVVNGKVDGHARGDAPTVVMGGLIGALLHPSPQRALVVGLGTGSSAGWLAAVPGIDRVDVLELEPAVVRVARDAASINHGALQNPKVHLVFGDAREVLLTTRERYDVVFSEPSNPYRAGISSLFTREFYEAAAQRLREGGVFVQWLQAYEIDAEAVRIAYATVASVFPSVETWIASPGDLVLVGYGPGAGPHDVAALRARIAEEPYRSALAHAWRVTDAEGFLARFVARPSLARAIAEQETLRVNTDDRNLLEFAFARGAGLPGGIDDALLMIARARGEDRPEITGGPVDWMSVEDQRLEMLVGAGRTPVAPPGAPRDLARRAEAYVQFNAHDMVGATAVWATQARKPARILELEVMGEALADLGDPEAGALSDRLRAYEPAEADALRARLLFQEGRLAEATDTLIAAFVRYREDPWPDPDLMRRAISEVAVPLAADRASARRLYDALAAPFVLHMLEAERLRARVELASRADKDGLCVEALAPYEPEVPWDGSLIARARCYAAAHDPRAAKAQDDVDAYLAQAGRPLGEGLLPPPSPP
jgi:spermidine synthase/MFS family permease